MIYIKINNLFNNFGQPDYKGVNINQFITGSQIYKGSYGVFATNENITTLPTDVEEITEVQYNTEKNSQQQTTNTNSQPVQNPVSLDDYKKNKNWELEQKCTEIKDGGFKSSCLGTEKTFDSSSENRTLIMGLAMKASLIASGQTLPDTSLDWKAKDEPVCYAWTPQQMITLGADLSTFMTNTIKHKEQLQQYVNSLTTVDDVQKVTWDTVIPTTNVTA